MERTLKQTSTPLSQTFFCSENVDAVQKTIRHKFRQESGLSLDRQNDSDLLALMRKVFIEQESANPYGQVVEQTRAMNEHVVSQALGDIRTNVSQFMTYVRDMDKPLVPIDQPRSTTDYGKKVEQTYFS